MNVQLYRVILFSALVRLMYNHHTYCLVIDWIRSSMGYLCEKLRMENTIHGSEIRGVALRRIIHLSE